MCLREYVGGSCLDAPPLRRMGWLGSRLAAEHFDAFEVEFSSRREYLDNFPNDVELADPCRIWDYVKVVEFPNKPRGQHIATEDQESGDCCGAGGAAGSNYRQAYQKAVLREEIIPRHVLMSYPYAIGRTAPDIGNGSLGRGAGSTGAWTAMAMHRYGGLFIDDAGVPAYSGRLSDKWGYSGVPGNFIDIARDNPMGRTFKITGSAAEMVETVRHELINHRPVTIANGQGWTMRPEIWHGYHVFIMSGSFSHQTVLIDWIDEHGGLAYRLNSWGQDAHGNPLAGDDGYTAGPPGGAWERADDLAKEFRRWDTELFACALFAGHPGPPDPGLV